jgi:hypothetical protein
MRHIKAYENVNDDELKVGDYVLCKDLRELSKNNQFFDVQEIFKNFISKNAGKVIKINNNDEIFISYGNVNIPDEILDYAFYTEYSLLKSGIQGYVIPGYETYSNIVAFNKNEIIYFSKNKEDVELSIQTIKYNL